MCELMLLSTAGNNHAARELHTALSVILVRLHSVSALSIETLLNYSYFRHGLESRENFMSLDADIQRTSAVITAE
jgi:hypothetical protein